MCPAQGPQHSDAGEALTCDPWVYHWAIALPIQFDMHHDQSMTLL